MRDVEIAALFYWEEELGLRLGMEDIAAWVDDLILDAVPIQLERAPVG